MDAEGLMRVANDLVQHDEPCFQKSAVNRAYYAAYHAIKAVAEKQLGFVEVHDLPMHKQLSQCLVDSHSQDIRALGIQLRGLHRQRIKCDYKLDTHLTNNDAPLAIMMGASLIAAFPDACKALSR